jgi:DNA segregation ATPase FtsK/SpoIIIE, S-DNA-T family
VEFVHRRVRTISSYDSEAEGRPVVLPPYPERTSPLRSPAAVRVLTISASVLGSAVLFFALPGNGLLHVAYLVPGLATILVSLAMGGRSPGPAKAYLVELRKTSGAIEEKAHSWWEREAGIHPDPHDLPALASSPRRPHLWERVVGDPVFGDVRVGTTSKPFGARLELPRHNRLSAEPDKDAVRLAASFIADHRMVPDLPLWISLRTAQRIDVGGPQEEARALVRALIAQAAYLHAPDDLVVAVGASAANKAAWEWVKWFPHVPSPPARASDRAGHNPVPDSPDQLADLLAGFLYRRPGFATANADPSSARPRLLVILDDLAAPAALTGADPQGLAGVTIVSILSEPAAGASTATRVAVADGALTVQDAAGTRTGKADGLSKDEAENLARSLTSLRLFTGAAFTDLLGIADPYRFDPARSWRDHTAHDRLRVPIGVGESGEPVVLDLKEAALGGMGPHGLCIGATGSGKSEVLRTLVLALACTHSSENLNFVLSDFKGGATFAGMAAMPHTAAVITNLADDLTMVDRMRDAIVGELNRRQEMLRDAGNHKNIHDYERARAAGAALTPMPTLLIVVDEFSELLDARREFIDLFMQIGRIGRSLGVHLLLASQRLDEGKIRGLDTYLSYRLGLKTFSAAESQAVLGVPDAYRLPKSPGAGFLKTVDTQDGGGMLTRLSASYVSGPARRPSRSGAGVGVDESRGAARADGLLLDVLVARMVGQGRQARQIWLPPLDEPPTLAMLMPHRIDTSAADPAVAAAATGTATGTDSPPRTPILEVPIGIVDNLLRGEQEKFRINLSSATGHAAVVGAPRAGKSTLVQTIVTALALENPPSEAQFFLLDFGGGGLSSLRDLPHVSGVAGRFDQEMVQRIIGEVSSILERREASHRRGSGDGADTARPEVFLAIDGWQTLRTDYEPWEQDVLDIAQRGLGFGIHLVITALRWAEIRSALRETISTRIELRLGNPTESEIHHRTAAEVPPRSPGRGLTADRLHFLSALPRIDTGRDASDLAAAVGRTVAAVRRAWPDQAAPIVRLLPELVAYDRLVSLRERPRRGVPLGLSGTSLEPVWLDFDADPHFFVLGESESGKTAVLRALIKGVCSAYTPDEARILTIDYRRTLLEETPESHDLGYCAAARTAPGLIEAVRACLDKRQPSSEVTTAQLRKRSWWSGPEVFVVVDDHDLVANSTVNPLLPLLEFLPLARDLGFHLILARASGGAARTVYEPVLQRLREYRPHGLVLSGDRDEGRPAGRTPPGRQPAGRGTFLSRHGRVQVQAAWIAPIDDEGDAPGER